MSDQPASASAATAGGAGRYATLADEKRQGDADRFSLGLELDDEYDGDREQFGEEDVDAALHRAIGGGDDEAQIASSEVAGTGTVASPSAVESTRKPLPPIIQAQSGATAPAAPVASLSSADSEPSSVPSRPQDQPAARVMAAAAAAQPHQLGLSDLALSPLGGGISGELKGGVRRDSDDSGHPGGGADADADGYATTPAYSARSVLADQSSLRGLAIVVACALTLLSVANFGVYIVSSNNNRACPSLDGYVVCVALLSAGLLGAVPLLLRRLDAEPLWGQSKGGRAALVAGGLLALLMGGYTVAVFILLSMGVCKRSILLRQTALLDGVLLCSAAILLALYALVRARFPSLSVGERGRALWRSHSVRLTLCLLLLAMCTGNLASVAVNGRGRQVFHHAITGWSPCRQAQECTTVDALRTAVRDCRDERGRSVDLSYCADLAPIPWTSPCPTLKCAQSSASSGDAVAWNWDMPSPDKCQAACDPNDSGDGSGGPELAYTVYCWDLRGHRSVGPGRCARKADASRSLPAPRCPPNPCHSCDELYAYNLFYTVLCGFFLLLLAADTLRSLVATRRDAAAGISEGKSGAFAKVQSDDVEGAAHDCETGATGDSSSSVSAEAATSVATGSSGSVGSQRSHSLLASLVSRAPRLCFLLVGVLLAACTALSLWACTHFLRVQCRDSLAISVVDAVVTFNAALATLLLTVRARRRAWSAHNPLEAIGLL